MQKENLLSSHQYTFVKVSGIRFIIYINISSLLYISIEGPCQCLVKWKEKYSAV